jgi:hypothetical protein
VSLAEEPDASTPSEWIPSCGRAQTANAPTCQPPVKPDASRAVARAMSSGPEVRTICNPTSPVDSGPVPAIGATSPPAL